MLSLRSQNGKNKFMTYNYGPINNISNKNNNNNLLQYNSKRKCIVKLHKI